MNTIPIAPDLIVYTSEMHRFGTDAVLLTEFSGYHKKDRICDLGTGCGIIPILMQRQNPPQEIYAVDIQPEAIEQLEAGLQASGGVQSKIYLICADLKELWVDAPLGKLDLVTCNPPYKAVDSGIQSQLTAQKIARHEVLCQIGDVCQAARKLLRFGGRLCLCNRPERLADTMIAMRQEKIEPKRLQFVAKAADAAPWLFLLEGRFGGKPFLQVEPLRIVGNGNAVHTRG
ncbi:MAG: methyltransferase [Ruminococcus sp.]|nr:methyltransferase [Ruminococcus sp.]